MTLPQYTKTWHNDVYPAISASQPSLSATGKRIVITGGAGGIGAATAEAFTIAGAASVIILGRTASTLQSTAKSIKTRHPNSSTTIVPIVADISSETSITAAFSTIATDHGKIDIFINNAAHMNDAVPILSTTTSAFQQAISINILGAYLSSKLAFSNLSPTNPVVINVATAASHVPAVRGYGVYSASKAGTWKMFEYFAFEHPEVKVFNVQPGIIESTGVASKAARDTGIHWEQQDTVELPANFLVWLASPEGEFLRSRFIWANWDVDELKAKKAEIEANPTMLTLGLTGWP